MYEILRRQENADEDGKQVGNPRPHGRYSDGVVRDERGTRIEKVLASFRFGVFSQCSVCVVSR
jgi:hypothetical protein